MKAVCKMNGLETTWPCTAAGCPFFGDCLSGYTKGIEKAKTMTNGDCFRALTDEELAEGLFQLYRATMEQDGGDISKYWCDSKGCGADDEDEIVCDDERHKDCILRWLKAEAKP